MDTNDLQDKASRLLRALEDGDAQRARDMLHGEDALDVALTLARNITMRHGALWTVPDALDDVLAILAAERMARETLARAIGEQSAVVNMAAGMSRAGRIAFAYGAPARILDEIERCKLADVEPPKRDATSDFGIATGIVRDLAALDHGRAVADLYASDEDVEARR